MSQTGYCDEVLEAVARYFSIVLPNQVEIDTFIERLNEIRYYLDDDWNEDDWNEDDDS